MLLLHLAYSEEDLKFNAQSSKLKAQSSKLKSAVKALEASLRDGSQTGIDVRGLKPTAILPRIENCEISTLQAEGNRDLEIATCPANHPETPQPLQSRFLNRGSFPKLAHFPRAFSTHGLDL